jgi:hypothetical protein
MLSSCSKKETTTANVSRLAVPIVETTNVIPSAITVVETLESKEIRSITNRAGAFFQAKDYDGLEAFTRKLRDSKECYDSGAWKVYFVYVGLEIPKEASDAEWTAHLAALHDWIDSRPDSITARVALANELVNYAWKGRGDGLADTVTDEGWQLFNERLNEAVEVLNKATPLKEQCPYWWTVKLETDLGLSTERSQYDATFEQATHVWPDYDPYYNHRAYYLLPRWNGTEGEWESDLEKSADRVGGPQGDLLYARVVWWMHRTHSFSNIFTECQISWPRVNRGFDVMEKQFPDSLAAKSEHAYLAIQARDVTVARKEFDKIEYKIDLSVWPSREKFDAFMIYSYGSAANGLAH